MKILSVVGARPQFIKAGAVSRAIAAAPDIEEVLVHTGQHFDADMSDVFFRDLEIPTPGHVLGVHGGGHGQMTGRMLEKLDLVVEAEDPDMVLVYGDTNSTLAAALCAAKLHRPVAHVEAGLRSFNRSMPEELNRVVADHLSTLLFCPTRAAVANLRREGITENVYNVGDVMYDATVHSIDRAQQRSDILERFKLEKGGYAVATVHRADNTDTPERLCEAIAYLQRAAQEHDVVIPLHPRTRKAAEAFGVELTGLTVVPPVGYLDMAKLLSGALCVYTDSGGLQKEAYFHRVPCVTLRSETEWVETIAAGWNRLWTDDAYENRTDIDEYGRGDAARKIVDILANPGRRE